MFGLVIVIANVGGLYFIYKTKRQRDKFLTFKHKYQAPELKFFCLVLLFSALCLPLQTVTHSDWVIAHYNPKGLCALRGWGIPSPQPLCIKTHKAKTYGSNIYQHSTH